MDDSTTSAFNDSDSQPPPGGSSSGVDDPEQFGQNLRLAMACIEGHAEPENTKAMPSDEAAILRRLKSLTQDMTSYHADLLELLVRFDELKGWESSGALHCAGWMNLEMGISPQLGWEYLRVGNKLRSLPTTRALFRVGKLSWSKIRLIVSVADAHTEKTLCHAALDASVTGVKRLCTGYRWKADDNGDAENGRALQQWDARAFRWGELSSGCTRIQLILPPETAQAFLNSVEQSLNQLDESDNTLSQRRADAAVLMAETALQAAGRDIATADRYQVIVSVDAAELAAAERASDVETEEADTDSESNTDSDLYTDSESNTDSDLHTDNEVNADSDLYTDNEVNADSDLYTDNEVHADNESASASESNNEPAHDTIGTPPKRATVKGAGPIARETARRIACDCSVVTHITANGEPTDIGRKSRLWPSAITRAIKERDQHCQFPGCTHTRHLQIHHIDHWADGGTTCVANGVCVCQSHHTLLHEGGYAIQRVDSSEQRLHEQFAQQQHADDITLFDFEKELRNDKASFDQVRTLSPTCYRFRIVDAAGQDIRNRQSADADMGDIHYCVIPAHSTRVECREPEPAVILQNSNMTSGVVVSYPAVFIPLERHLWAHSTGWKSLAEIGTIGHLLT